MWRKIKEILCKHSAYKDESTTTNTADVTLMRTAMGDPHLLSSPPATTTSSQTTKTPHYHQASRKSGSNALNKTDEHCRSLFNLLPTSLRPRHHRQTSSTKKSVDASTTTTADLSPSMNVIGNDYDSGYMSQTLLNRTPSYGSCYAAVPTTMVTPSTTMVRQGSIENLLQGHSKSNPAVVRVLVRKNFEPFAQAHIGVTKGTVVTALFSRGPWLYVRIDSSGKTGYIPRIICSVSHHRMLRTNHQQPQQHYQHHLSVSSTDSSSLKDEELDLTKLSLKTASLYRHAASKAPINRYLSHSSAIITDTHPKFQDQSKRRLIQIAFDERERRNTYTLPRPPRSSLTSAKDRRLTVSSLQCSTSASQQESLDTHQFPDTSTNAMPTRDTDSSSTQDSGYSESTPYILVQQLTPETERSTSYSLKHRTKKSAGTPHYATLRRPIVLQASHSKENPLIQSPRSSVLTDLSLPYENKSQEMLSSSSRRLPEFALIRNVRREKSQQQQQQPQQRLKSSLHNLPKSHVQIPASIFLNHHRQKQHFATSAKSAFRPIQPLVKAKRASSEGHSPSLSSSSSSSSLNVDSQASSKRRRLSCDLPVPLPSSFNSNSLTRSMCEQSSMKFNEFSRTMSEILCDQFSELNLDAIEQDSLLPQPRRKCLPSQQCLFIVVKDYRSSRASFAVQRGDCVHVLKQVGRACVLVRKQQTGQLGFLPKALLGLQAASTSSSSSSRIDTFLEMHGYRETII